MDILCRILVFGHSAMLGKLAADLRASPLLHVTEQREVETLGGLSMDMILVDAAQSTPEQFRLLIPLCPTILSVDPETHQLIVLSSPHQADLTDTVRMIEMISLILRPPV